MTDLVSSSSPLDAVVEFGIHPRRGSAGVVTLEIVGEIDLFTAPSLLTAARDELAGCRALVLDLAGVTFCSARGVGTLVEIRRLAAQHGTAVHISRPSDEVRRVADLTGSPGVLAEETATGVPVGDRIGSVRRGRARRR
jgi:anti-anti-sigma factor